MPNSENLHSYKKGQSGNLKGKPKGAKNRATILNQFLSIKTKYINPVTEKEETGTFEHIIELSLLKLAVEGDLAAIKEIKDSKYGKIFDKQKIEHSGKIKIKLTGG